VMFRDITTLLGNAGAFRRAVDALVQPWAGSKIDRVAGIEARGFILGGALAAFLRRGFVPVRKPGKLPRRSLREAYGLEYGDDALELHVDALVKGARVLVVDDLLATGGTAAATERLVRRAGGTVVGFVFLVELAFLRGAERLGAERVVSLLKYEVA